MRCFPMFPPTSSSVFHMMQFLEKLQGFMAWQLNSLTVLLRLEKQTKGKHAQFSVLLPISQGYSTEGNSGHLRRDEVAAFVIYDGILGRSGRGVLRYIDTFTLPLGEEET